MKKQGLVIFASLWLGWMGICFAVGQNGLYGENNQLLQIQSAGQVTHFVFKGNTDDSYNLVIDAATLDGSVLQAGDEIGVFTPAGLCVGAAVWTGTTPLPLTVWADDSQTGQVDGYKEGESISLRVWDLSAHITADFPAFPTYTLGNGTFGDGAYSRISHLTTYTIVTQTLPLTDRWSWISLHATAADLDITRVLAPLDKLEIVVNGGGQFYIPSVINTIGQFNMLEGYKIYLASRDTLQVTGRLALPETPIPLARGWNFISYLPRKAMNAEIALASIRTNLAIIKNDLGGYYIPGSVNTLGEMQPGKGYKAYLSSSNDLIYPADASLGKSLAQLPIKAMAPCSHYRYRSQTGENYSVLVSSIRVAGQSLEPGDEIGLFTESGLCVGGSGYSADGLIAMVAWQDDGSTPVQDGYNPGERMVFRVWRAADEREIDLAADYSHGGDAFAAHDYASASLTEISAPHHFGLSQNYPNPFNPATTIQFEMPVVGQVRLSIYNSVGQLVRELVQGQRGAGNYSVLWNGKDASGQSVPSGVYFCRLDAGEFKQMRKMILMK